jgi:hypothetical protein
MDKQPVFTSNSSLLRSARVDPSIDIQPHRCVSTFLQAGGYADDLYQDAALDYLERKARGNKVIAPMFSVQEARRQMWSGRGYIRQGKHATMRPKLELTHFDTSSAPIEEYASLDSAPMKHGGLSFSSSLHSIPAPDANAEQLLDMRSTALRLRDSLRSADHRALVDLALEGHSNVTSFSSDNPLFDELRSLTRVVRNSARLSAIVAGAFNG